MGEGQIANSCSFAGSDTTAITLRAILYLLVKHPEAYEKLRDEVDAFETDGKFTESVPFGAGNEMPYL
jgi:cytochrome P450